jgi:hypothetical protein
MPERPELECDGSGRGLFIQPEYRVIIKMNSADSKDI